VTVGGASRKDRADVACCAELLLQPFTERRAIPELAQAARQTLDLAQRLDDTAMPELIT